MATTGYLCYKGQLDKYTQNTQNVENLPLEMSGHKTVIIVDMKFFCIAEMSSKLASMSGSESHYVTDLDGVIHLKNEGGGDTIICSCNQVVLMDYISTHSSE